MNLKKIISKGLIIGLLFNNLGYSFANTKNLDERYEIIEGNNITMNNLLEENTPNVEIVGNTLVNILNVHRTVQDASSLTTVSSTGLIKTVIGTENVEFTGSFGSSKLDYSIDRDKEYSLIVDIKKNTLNSIFRFYNYGTFINFPFISEKINPGDTGIKVFKLKHTNINIPPDDVYVDKINGYHMLATGHDANAGVGNTIEYTAMILEGDWTNREVPKYFEGMKSVGDLENNKLSISSSNKNLIGELTIGGLYGVSGEEDLNAVKWRKSDFIDVRNLPRVLTHTSDNTQRSCLFQYDINKNMIGNYTTLESVTLRDDCAYVRVCYENYDATMCQLEVGDKATDFSERIEDSKEIDLKEPLRGVNDIKDRIVKKNGQWMIERRYSQTVITGDDIAFSQESYKVNEYTSILTTKIDNVKDPKIYNLTSDKLPTFQMLEEEDYEPLWFSNRKTEGISYVNNLWGFCIRLSNSKTGVTSSDSAETIKTKFKNYLNANNITVVYMLENPIYEPLNIDLPLNTYLDTTYVSSNSTIPCIKVTIDRAINKAIEAIKIAKEKPTTENISLARMWANLLKESIKKDEINSEINNINKVEDLKIEKKKISVNVDIYIKPLNSLTMSVSTNSIIFDEYNNTEDMEKLKAVDITIESSLPYRLNSYLVSEIKNKDGSNIIPKEQFNIRLNGETNYKAFNNINEKLILKDDCSAGVDNIHSIDLILKSGKMNEADIYKTTLKFEAEQK